MPAQLHTINTLTLDVFIQCLCKQDYSGLIISGECENLEQVWGELFAEYLELNAESKEYKTLLLILQKYGKAQSRHMALTASHMALTTGYNEEAQLALKHLGYKLNFNTDDLQAYMTELDKLKKHINSLSLELKQVEREYQQMNNGGTMTEQKYMEYIAAVGKFMGFAIPLNTLVKQWAGYCSLFDKQNG